MLPLERKQSCAAVGAEEDRGRVGFVRMRAAPGAGRKHDRQPHQHGRTPLKGKRMGSLAEIAKAATFKPIRLTGRDGRTRTALVHEFVCLWYKPFHTRAFKVTLVRNPNGTKDFDIAIATTDTTATAAQTIERYDARWVIETVHQEAKNHGVGDARNRVKAAVQRTVPFGFLTITITIAWYQL